MEIYHGARTLSRVLPRVVVTIGNFDGVHLGHRMIIQRAIDLARARGGTAVAYTFRPHPRIALRPENHLPMLATYDERKELLRAAGIDVLIEEPFSREFSEIAPEQFFTDVILRRLNAEVVVVGYDFAFGRGRAGHLESLEAFCRAAGVELQVVPAHREDGEVVSSSRIRQHLLAGEIEVANHLLGYEFRYRGVVVKGDGRGRKIGFPTANLKIEDKLALPFGVYATRAVAGGTIYKSVTNIGVRPTFKKGVDLPALVETHLLDTTIDLYGATLEVHFVRRIRDERTFPGVEALKAQISLDISAARACL